MKKSLSRSKKRVVFAAIGLILVVAVVFWQLKSRPVAAAWFNDSWLYRKAVAITNSSGGALTDFQVSFTIDTTDSTKFRSDCYDIRVTDINGKLLPHWIEESNPGCNNAATKIWVKVPTLPTSGQTIYVYYGNPSATNVADGNKVFELFDQFDKLDQSKWTVSGSPTVPGGVLTLNNSATIVSKNAVTTSAGLGQVIFRAKQALVNLSGGKIGLTSTTNTASDFSAADSVAISYGNTEEKLTDFGGANKVAHYKLEETTLTDAAAIDDASSNDADMQVVTGATSATGKINNALTFNGSTQYLKQEIIDDQTGASWGPTYHGLSLAAGSAFARVQGVNLANFASDANDYMLVMKDGESDVAWGYIDTADAAEALGSDLFDPGAGTFDSGTYNWVAWGTNIIENDAGALKITYVDNSNGALDYLKATSDLTSDLTVGKLYKLTFDAKVNAGSSVSLQVNGYAVAGQPVSITETNFTSKTIYFTATETVGATSNYIATSGMGTGEIIWLDNLVLKEVTDVGTDGVHIVSTKAGSTRNWAGISATFNYNYSAYTFEVRETEFQITGNLTVGAWVKTGDSMGDIISKWSGANGGCSFSLGNWNKPALYLSSTGNRDTTNRNQGTVTIYDNIWHFVVGTFDSSTRMATVYVDGTIASSIQDSFSTIADTSREVMVGSGGENGGLDGSIDEPFVLSSALTADQIKALYEYYTLSTSHTATKTIPANTADGTNDTNYHVYNLNSLSASSTLVQDTTTLATSTTNLPTVSQYMRIQNTDATNNLSVDWLAVTKIASTTPTATAASEEQSQGPVAYYKFDEGTGTTANDSTSNRNAGTLTNMSATAATNSGWITEDACIAGKCLGFDGINDYVSMGDVLDGTFAGTDNKFTIETWFKPSSVMTNNVILGKWATADDQRELLLMFTTNSTIKLQWYTDGTGSNYRGVLSTTQFTNTGKWYHVVYAYDGTLDTNDGLDRVKIYVDGRLENGTLTTLGTLGGIANTTSPFRLGLVTGLSSFKGFLDDVKIYPYARTAAQIKTDYNAGKTRAAAAEGVAVGLGANKQNLPDSLSNGLVGYWKMDEATWSGTINEVLDSSGNGNNGQAQGATGGKAYPSSGKFGNGGYFDGVDDYVSLGNTSSLNSAQTVSAWTKTNKASSAQAIAMKKRAATGGQYYALYVDSSNNLTFYINGASAGNGISTAANTIDLNTWVFVVGTYDGSTLRTYINGAASGTPVSLTAGDYSNSDSFFVGIHANTTAQKFSGQIDDLRIYNRALSAKEVRDLYNWAPGPVAYWDFEDASGTTVSDKSGNSNNGTWSGSGATHWTTGKYGKAGGFNATNDKVQTSSPIITGTGDFTIGAWINRSGTGGTDSVVSNYGTGSCSSGVELGVNGANNNIFIWVAAGTSLIGTKTISANTWHYILATRANGTVSLYVDGQQDTTGSRTSSIGGNCNIAIGNGPNYTTERFQGLIDDVKIYNYARTASQITEDMLGGHPAVASAKGGALAYYKFDEGYGTTANNSGSGGNSLNGAFGASTAAPSWTNNGKFGKALQFDGSNDYVNGTLSGISNTKRWAVTAWFRTSDTAGYLFDNRTSELNGAFLYTSASDTLNAGIVTVGVKKAYTYNVTSTNNKWHHVVLQRDGDNSMSLYIDSTLISPSSKQTDIDITSVDESWSSFTLGNRHTYNAYQLQGLLDEFKIYNYALTSDEILTEYNRGSAVVLGTLSNTAGLSGGSIASSSASAAYCIPGDTTSCASPVLEWNFEEGTGTTTGDVSGNGKTGTWNGTGAHWTNGKYGKAGKFNGTNDYVSGTVPLSTETTWTMEAWFKTSNPGVATRAPIITTRQSNNDKGLYVKNNKVNLFYYPQVIDTAGTTTISSNTWYHVALIRNGTAVTVYVNGILDQTQTVSDSTTISGSFYAGGGVMYGWVYYNGSIDGAKVYNYARSPAQIAWDYNRGAPLVWFKMNECQGSTINNSIASPSGNLITGTITIGATGTQDGIGTCTDGDTTNAWYNGRTGKYNSSLNFDGTDDYVTTTDINALDSTSQFTFSAWANSTSSTAGPLISKATDLNNRTHLWWHSDNLIYFNISNSGNAFGTISEPSHSVWHHVVMVFDGNQSGNANRLKAYIDGIQKTLSFTGTIPATTANQSSSVLVGKAGESANYFSGQMDDVQIYNYALTSAQVKQLYNQGAGVRFGPATGNP